MIPYTTIRQHLDAEHWQNTSGLTWLQLVHLHEEAHRSDQDHGHGQEGVMVRPASVQLELLPVVVDTPTTGVL
jgi:hypothetical protein